MSDWKSEIIKEWHHRKTSEKSDFLFPLIAQSYDHDEIITMVDTLLTGRLTMASKVREFEQKFAKIVGSKYAVMVNSGSSANLLALAVAANPMRKKRLNPGDEVIVPSICWSTSVWPIIQMGLKPVFVDIDARTLNADLADLRKKITPKTRGIMAVHILGNAAPMKEMLQIARENDLILLEDTCESLGSTSDGKYLGTLGDFGMYSFYYSHHLTTGEGGMVTCNTLEDYDLLKCLRAHGWTRELHNREEIEKRHSDLDSRFLFVNLGYNLRPMEIQAAMGMKQLDRLPELNGNRIKNWNILREALRASPKWKEQLSFPEASPGVNAVWFGFPCLLNAKFASKHKQYLDYLTSKGVENRPVISGNFTRQPALKLCGVDLDPTKYPNAETVNQRGFFIGLHTELLKPAMVQQLVEILLGFEF